MDNFRKMYPHLKNLEDSILKKASLKSQMENFLAKQ